MSRTPLSGMVVEDLEAENKLGLEPEGRCKVNKNNGFTQHGYNIESMKEDEISKAY